MESQEVARKALLNAVMQGRTRPVRPLVNPVVDRKRSPVASGLLVADLEVCSEPTHPTQGWVPVRLIWDPRALGPPIPPTVHVPPPHPQERRQSEANPESNVQRQLQLKLQLYETESGPSLEPQRPKATHNHVNFSGSAEHSDGPEGSCEEEQKANKRAQAQKLQRQRTTLAATAAAAPRATAAPLHHQEVQQQSKGMDIATQALHTLCYSPYDSDPRAQPGQQPPASPNQPQTKQAGHAASADSAGPAESTGPADSAGPAAPAGTGKPRQPGSVRWQQQLCDPPAAAHTPDHPTSPKSFTTTTHPPAPPPTTKNNTNPLTQTPTSASAFSSNNAQAPLTLAIPPSPPRSPLPTSPFTSTYTPPLRNPLSPHPSLLPPGHPILSPTHSPLSPLTPALSTPAPDTKPITPPSPNTRPPQPPNAPHPHTTPHPPPSLPPSLVHATHLSASFLPPTQSLPPPGQAAHSPPSSPSQPPPHPHMNPPHPDQTQAPPQQDANNDCNAHNPHAHDLANQAHAGPHPNESTESTDTAHGEGEEEDATSRARSRQRRHRSHVSTNGTHHLSLSRSPSRSESSPSSSEASSRSSSVSGIASEATFRPSHTKRYSDVSRRVSSFSFKLPVERPVAPTPYPSPPQTPEYGEEGASGSIPHANALTRPPVMPTTPPSPGQHSTGSNPPAAGEPSFICSGSQVWVNEAQGSQDPGLQTSFKFPGTADRPGTADSVATSASWGRLPPGSPQSSSRASPELSQLGSPAASWFPGQHSPHAHSHTPPTLSAHSSYPPSHPSTPPKQTHARQGAHARASTPPKKDAAAAERANAEAEAVTAAARAAARAAAGPVKLPVVIFLHATGSDMDSQRNRQEQYAFAGYFTMAMDCRYHGERRGLPVEPTLALRAPVKPSQKPVNAYQEALVRAWKGNGEHPFLLDNVFDILCCLDYLATREEVDMSRVGITGVSLGGMHAWLTAVIEPRIAVTAPMIGVQGFGWAIHHNAFQARVASIPNVFEAAAKDMGKPSVDAAVVEAVWKKLLPGMLGGYDAPISLPALFPKPFIIVNGALDPRCPMPGVLEAFQCTQRAYMRRIRAAQQIEKGERREQLRLLEEQAQREREELRAQEEEERNKRPADPRDAPAKPQQLKAPLAPGLCALITAETRSSLPPSLPLSDCEGEAWEEHLEELNRLELEAIAEHEYVVQMVNALAVLYVEPGVGHAETAGMHKAVKEFLDMYLKGPAWRQHFSADTRARLASTAT